MGFNSGFKGLILVPVCAYVSHKNNLLLALAMFLSPSNPGAYKFIYFWQSGIAVFVGKFAGRT